MSQDSYDTLEIVKFLEMKELEEEETWIKNLKSQRERVTHIQIEKFKFEIEARDQKILELTTQLEQQKLANTETKKLQAALERAEQQIREKEQENIDIREDYDKRNYTSQIKIEELEKHLREASALIKKYPPFSLQNELVKSNQIVELLNSEKQELKELAESAAKNIEELEEFKNENDMLRGEM
jgi:multidrug resistance efflux pump